MNSIIVDPKAFEENKLIGCGSEGSIYKYDDNTAIKIFSNSITKRKLKKIELLSEIQIENFMFPKDLILDKYSKPIGYSMDLVKNGKKLYHFLKNKSLEEKVKYLILLESLLKKAHEKNIIVGDIRGRNELVDAYLNLKMTDTDSYIIGNLKPDVVCFYGEVYLTDISNKIDSNFDKFIFAAFTLKIFLENYSSLLDVNGLIDEVTFSNLPKELKEVYYNIFSDSKEKEYFGNHLNLILKK